MADKEYQIKIKVDSKQLKQDLQKNTQEVKKFTDSSSKGIKSMDIAWGAFVGNLASQALTRAISGLFDLGRTAIQVAANLEDLETQFTVLTGSATDAKKIIKDLADFANNTPFELPELATATKQLIQAKVAQEELIPTLQRIGDISAITGRDVRELSVAFARLKDRGAVTLEELQKFDDAGAGLLRTMAEMNNVSIAKLRKEISAGKVSFDVFDQAVRKVTSKGGSFADGMIKASGTLSGKLSTLNGSWDLFIGNLAKSNTGVLKTTVDLAISLIQAIDKQSKANEAVATNTDILTMSYSKLNEELSELEKLQKSGTYASDAQAERINKISQLLVTNGKELQKIEELQRKISNMELGLEQRYEGPIDKTIELRKELQTLQEILSGKKPKEAPSGDTGTGGTDVDPNEEARIEARKKFLEEKNEEIRNIQLQHYALMSEQEREASGQRDEQAWLDFETLIQNYGEQNAIELQMLQDKINAEKDLKKQAILEEELEAKKRLKLTQKAKKEQQKADKEDKDLRLKGERDFFNNLAILSQSGSKELFEINKVANMARIVANTPDTISSAYKAGSAIGGPPIGAVFAATAGAAQLALLQQQASAKPPAFQEGGILNAGGNSLTGDNNLARFNDREMFLNMRQQAVLFSAIDSGAIGGAGLQSELLAELVEIQRTKNTEFSINGETLMDELDRLENRRLN